AISESVPEPETIQPEPTPAPEAIQSVSELYPEPEPVVEPLPEPELEKEVVLPEPVVITEPQKIEPTPVFAKEPVEEASPVPPVTEAVSSGGHQSVAQVAAAWEQAAVAAAPAPIVPEVITDELQSQQITAGLT